MHAQSIAKEKELCSQHDQVEIETRRYGLARPPVFEKARERFQ